MRSSEQFNIQHSKFNIAKGNHSTFKIQYCVYDAKPWAIRFMWIKVTMPHDKRPWITFMQILQQTSQRTLLCLRSGVAMSLAVTGKTSNIRHPDRMSVMISAMRPDLFLRTSTLNSAVSRNHIVISTPLPAQRAVVAVDIRHSDSAARLIGGAMHYNQGYRSHKIYKLTFNGELGFLNFDLGVVLG